MKMQSFKNTAKKAFGIFLLVTAVGVSAQAHGLKDTLTKDSLDKIANVQCLGKQEDMFLFKVKYNNILGTKFNVSVKDKDGYVIFQDSYTDKVFNKLFKVPAEDEGKLTITIRNLKDNTTNTFDINTNTRVFEEILITKIN